MVDWRRRAKDLEFGARRRWRPLVTQTVGRHAITYSIRDTYIGPGLFWFGAWEPHLIRLLQSFDLRDKVAIDVGANIGTVTLPLSDAVGPGGQVIALEPDGPTADLLDRNLAQNGVRNVRTLRLAAGANSGRAPFVRDLSNLGNHRIVDTSEVSEGLVDVVSIDELTADLPEHAVAFIKVDVQGYEGRVLEGMHATLARNPGVVLQVEISAGEWAKPDELVANLRSLGFDGFEVGVDRFIPIQPERYYRQPYFRDYADLIMVRDSARLEKLLDGFVPDT
jgi:FkbM family methyltransferase